MGRPGNFGLQLKLEFVHVTLLLRSFKCFCVSNWLWYKCYKTQALNMIGGSTFDLTPACMLSSSFTIPGVMFYPPEALRSSLLPPHLTMFFPPCLCSSGPLCPALTLFISPRSTYPLRIYSALMSSINSPSHPSPHHVWKDAPGLRIRSRNWNTWVGCKGRDSGMRNSLNH